MLGKGPPLRILKTFFRLSPLWDGAEAGMIGVLNQIVQFFTGRRAMLLTMLLLGIILFAIICIAALLLRR